MKSQGEESVETEKNFHITYPKKPKYRVIVGNTQNGKLELPLYTALCKAMAYKEAEALKFASIPHGDPHSSPGLGPYNWLSLKLLFLQRF